MRPGATLRTNCRAGPQGHRGGSALLVLSRAKAVSLQVTDFRTPTSMVGKDPLVSGQRSLRGKPVTLNELILCLILQIPAGQ